MCPYMRLTVNLEERYYRAAKALAKAEDLSLSMAVNRLIAMGFERPTPEGQGDSGFPVSRGAKPVTAERVEEIEADG